MTRDVTPHDGETCQGCGGIYRFDTSVPSVRWNAAVRAAGLPEFLCLACIVRAFYTTSEPSFTARLSGDCFNGALIEVRVGSEPALDAAHVQDENNKLRRRIFQLETLTSAGMTVAEPVGVTAAAEDALPRVHPSEFRDSDGIKPVK